MNRYQELIESYLNGEITEEMTQELSQWLKQDKENVKIFIRETHAHQTLRNHFLSEQVIEEYAEEAERQPARKKKSSRRMRVRRARRRSRFSLIWVSIAACVLITAGAYLYNVYLMEQTGGMIRARIIETDPGVIILRDGKKIPVKINDELYAGDKVHSEEGTVRIKYTDEDTVISITKQTIIEFNQQKGAKRIMLNRGEIKCTVAPQPPNRSMKLFTEHAEAEVLGTQLTFSKSVAKTKLEVMLGKVRFTRKWDRKSIEVTSGYFAEAGKAIDLIAKHISVLEGTLWAPYIECSFKNTTWSGNPFDLIAAVTFTHKASGETRTTQMFYDENNIWKFRFCGTRTGLWTFSTNSSDADLHGRTGTVVIKPNPDPKIKGFLAKSGQKYARQIGENGELEGVRFNVYMNAKDFPADGKSLSAYNTAHLNSYIADAQQYGFNTVFFGVIAGSWFKLGTLKYTEHTNKNPDPETFRILEKVITEAHSKGIHVHIWAWGDETRKWTSVGVGGINGLPDKRLQRYIAARLGPLPGWTMGYGFGVQEYVKEDQAGEWAQYLHDHFGWSHLVCARTCYHSELDVKSYGSTKVRLYDEIIKNMESDKTRPHLYEERHAYLRNENLSMDGTRRFLWNCTMAGGMGCWWGFFSGKIGSDPPYPNPEQLLCASRFWKGRFLLDMQPDNAVTDGYCLRENANKHYVFYKENTSSIHMDLSKMNGSQPAVAVDTKKGYSEINLGILNPETKTWTAPYTSDWAVAVGNFKSVKSPGTIPGQK
jgi:ferric-dicitrate binding protein FerR (iron transport regulator)